LGLLLHGGPDLEETTTPELELVGIVPNSQEVGSQQQLQLPPGSAAAAGAGAAGAGLGGSSRAAAGAAAAAGRAGARGGIGGAAAAGDMGAGSSGRGRGPGVVCEEVTAKQMLFPVFRPLKERKCVILVRHGESSESRGSPLCVCVFVKGGGGTAALLCVKAGKKVRGSSRATLNERQSALSVLEWMSG
jgi:hypothetical protein